MSHIRNSSVVFLMVFSLASVSNAAIQPMSREDIVELAEYGVGYSYYWGHGAWRTDGAYHGSCSGSCPNCTHSGSYGADCSGFVAKVWQVPEPVALDKNSHPYSTYNFRWENQHWSQISRSDAQVADAMVHRNSSNTGGHVVLFDHGDPWGQMWTWEARGCSYGIVHNLRTLDSSYVAIRRDELADSPATGTLIGAVYIDRGDGDKSERIPGATVVANDVSTTARDGDAIWSFELDSGDYTVRANADGFEENSRDCAVRQGQTTWCSIGLTEVCVPDCSGRTCGQDGCGGVCGTCSKNEICDESGQCVCQPDCTGLNCGPDPVCGQSCGNCGDDQECTQGRCVDVVCQKDCENIECGPDPVCGESCGTCPAGLVCSPAGGCVEDTCRPQCSALACGPDPSCAKSCGVCSRNRICNDAGQCDSLDPDLGKLFGVVHEASGTSEIKADDDSKPVVANAHIISNDGQTLDTDENGYWELQTKPGTRVLLVSALGYEASESMCVVLAGQGTECMLELHQANQDYQQDETSELVGGCSTTGDSSAHGWWLLLVWGFFRRKKQVR